MTTEIDEAIKSLAEMGSEFRQQYTVEQLIEKIDELEEAIANSDSSGIPATVIMALQGVFGYANVVRDEFSNTSQSP